MPEDCSPNDPKAWVTVFCGSRPGRGPGYLDSARTVGRVLAQQGFGLVYGGASSGTMGAVADGHLDAGGQTLGVTMDFLETHEILHTRLSQEVRTGSLSLRKAEMVDRSQALLALPGAYGTLDELFEVLTLRQLGILSHPIAVWNYQGYFDPLLAWVETAVESEFLSPELKELLEVLPAEEEALVAWLEKVPAPDPVLA